MNNLHLRQSNKLIAKKIYKGYIDDPRNTDNAWIEAEIWNFHFCDEEKLDELIPNVNKILKLHSNLNLYLASNKTFNILKDLQ